LAHLTRRAPRAALSPLKGGEGGRGFRLKQSRAKETFLSFALAVAFLLALGACGFQPLYGPRGTTDVPDEFAAIEIQPIRDRLGQELHNNLLDLLNPKGEPTKPKYELVVTLSENRQELAVQKTAFATRANLTMTAQFTLRDSKTKKPLAGGSSIAVSSYDVLRSDFATLAAEKDARSRALLQVAEDIRTRLALYFRRQ
jgi:LPS-assembly lipoprotein